MNIMIKNFVSARTVWTLAAGSMLLFGPAALACNIAAWSGDSQNVLFGQPAPDGIQRYSGFCAMQTVADTETWVQDNSPGGNITRIRARFYVLNDLATGQTAQIYRGYSTDSGTGPLFTVTLSDSGAVILTDDATGLATDPQTSSTSWISVEIDWSQGAGDGAMSLSVNGQAPDTVGSLSNSGAALASVRLGNLDGAMGSLNFDAYESRRTTEVGRLCVGDADGNGTRGIGDLEAIFDEFQFDDLASGNPDADENGSIGIGDLETVFEIFQFGTPDCSA